MADPHDFLRLVVTANDVKSCSSSALGIRQEVPAARRRGTKLIDMAEVSERRVSVAHGDRTVCDSEANATLVAEPESHADRAAPEIKVAQREVEAVARRVVLQEPEVSQVAAKADTVVEVAVNSAAQIHTPVVRRETAEERRSGNVASQQAGAASDIWPDTAAVLAANRHADHHIAH